MRVTQRASGGLRKHLKPRSVPSGRGRGHPVERGTWKHPVALGLVYLVPGEDASRSRPRASKWTGNSGGITKPLGWDVNYPPAVGTGDTVDVPREEETERFSGSVDFSLSDVSSTGRRKFCEWEERPLTGKDPRAPASWAAQGGRHQQRQEGPTGVRVILGSRLSSPLGSHLCGSPAALAAPGPGTGAVMSGRSMATFRAHTEEPGQSPGLP